MYARPANDRARRRLALLAAACAAVLTGACAETRIALHTAKRFAPDHENSVAGTYKVGNPYRINGVWYRPAVDYTYVETGIASWYGPQFHKKRTANGQVFDMNAISAAHRTLPLPSIVRVTNLENGRSLNVLVNDRGPFARGRIIDVSRRTAQLLGFERQGTARVRVEIVADESRRIAMRAQGRDPDDIADTPQRVSVVALPEDETAAPAGPAAVTTVPVAAKTRLFVQAGAFVAHDRADRARQALAPIGPTRVVEATVGDRLFYRVRLGPVGTVPEGDRLLDRVVENGYPDARLVVD